MNYCFYGCGKEGKYLLKNGRYCCSKYCTSCTINIEKRKNSMKKIFNQESYKLKMREKTLNYLKNENSEKKKDRIQKIKAGMKNKNSGKIISEKAKKRLENLDYRKNLSIKSKKRFENQEERKKLSKKFRFTIEKIKEKYPFFLEIEEIRYNPENDEKEIQVRCKNSNCKNSKENNGWFSPSGAQISNRIFVSKKLYGRSYFFCSKNCKQESELFNRRVEPESYKKYWEYYKKVILH